MKPAMFPIPSRGRQQYRCTECGLTYGSPLNHEPGSDDCNESRREREWSVRR